MRLGILLVLALCALPMEAFAAPSDAGVGDASVAAVVVPIVAPMASPDAIDPSTASTAVVNAVASRDWQVALAGLLSIAWLIFLRFFSDSNDFFHSVKGKAMITAISSICGALIPVLQTHTFTLAMLISALTAATFTAMATIHPTKPDVLPVGGAS